MPLCPPQRGKNGQVHIKFLSRFSGSGSGDGGAAAGCRGRGALVQNATSERRWSNGRRCPHHAGRLGAGKGHAQEDHRSTDEQRKDESSQD